MSRCSFLRSLAAILIAAIFLPAAYADGSYGEHRQHKAVFVMTNSADRNEIAVFARDSDGTLSFDYRVATGGRGSGGNVDPLQSQGSLLLSEDHSLLFAANAGTGDISVFRVEGAELALVQRVPSGGSSPVAIAQHGRLLYVLNDGGNDNVVGFTIEHGGHLVRIQNSLALLSNNDAGASGLALSPDGQFLAVTERLNGIIDIFHVQANGTLSTAKTSASNGAGVFSVLFAPNGALLVTEAASSSISSYAVQADGSLTTISNSVSTFGAATCWHGITPDGRFTYTSNSASASISGYSIGNQGSLTPLGGTVVGTNPTGSANLDIAITTDGKFLYTLNSGTGSIGMFAIQKDGQLNNLGTVGGLPAKAGLNGIAAN